MNKKSFNVEVSSESLMSNSGELISAPFRFMLLCLLIMIIWGIFFFFPATDHTSFSFYPKCPFYSLTRLYCAGCGSLRSFSCLANGNISGAWHKNKLMLLLMPFIFFSFLAYGARCFNLRFPQIFIKPAWIWLLLVIIMVFMVLRNIPSYPFCLLAPY